MSVHVTHMDMTFIQTMEKAERLNYLAISVGCRAIANTLQPLLLLCL